MDPARGQGDADFSGGNIGGYRIVRKLGKGGMGAVYEAESPDGARVALKVFASTGAHADFLRKRFVAEGTILSRLSSEHLVTVRKTGCDPESCTPYFTMDQVLDAAGEPCTLENLRRRGGLDEVAIAAIYADLRAALVFLHENGVVHRDIKLENVLVDANGRAVLSDFGVSRILRQDLRDEIALTTTFAADRAPIMGSAGYLSPELMEGKAATPADDAWALGVLVFRLLTGVWYEEDSSAMELTAGFELDWEAVFSVLLNADPARRQLAFGVSFESDKKPAVQDGVAFGDALHGCGIFCELLGHIVPLGCRHNGKKGRFNRSGNV